MRKSEDSVVWYLDFWIFTATALGRMDSIPAEIQGNEEYTDENEKTTFITQGAVIAAIYVVLVFVFDYWSFGPIQFRVAEALTILPVFTPAAVPGLLSAA